MTLITIENQISDLYPQADHEWIGRGTDGEIILGESNLDFTGESRFFHNMDVLFFVMALNEGHPNTFEELQQKIPGLTNILRSTYEDPEDQYQVGFHEPEDVYDQENYFGNWKKLVLLDIEHKSSNATDNSLLDNVREYLLHIGNNTNLSDQNKLNISSEILKTALLLVETAYNYKQETPSNIQFLNIDENENYTLNITEIISPIKILFNTLTNNNEAPDDFSQEGLKKYYKKIENIGLNIDNIQNIDQINIEVDNKSISLNVGSQITYSGNDPINIISLQDGAIGIDKIEFYSKNLRSWIGSNQSDIFKIDKMQIAENIQKLDGGNDTQFDILDFSNLLNDSNENAHLQTLTDTDDDKNYLYIHKDQTLPQNRIDIENFEAIIGTSEDDLIINSNFEYIFGYKGNDFLKGNDKNEHFMGGMGADTIDGGSGFDQLYYDQKYIEVGNDYSSLEQVENGIIINNWGEVYDDGFGSTDLFININALHATDYNDILNAEDSNHSVNIYGYDGNDIITGADSGYSEETSTLDGGNGNDTIYGSEEINNLIYGGKGDDFIQGGKTDDQIFTGDTDSVTLDNDTIIGSTGNDEINYTGSNITIDYSNSDFSINLLESMPGGLLGNVKTIRKNINDEIYEDKYQSQTILFDPTTGAFNTSGLNGSIDKIIGSNYDDLFNINNDTIYGGNGNDTFISPTIIYYDGNNNSYVDGENGNDNYYFLSDIKNNIVQDTGTNPGDYDTLYLSSTNNNTFKFNDNENWSEKGIEEITKEGTTDTIIGDENDQNWNFENVFINQLNIETKGGNDTIQLDEIAGIVATGSGDDIISQKTGNSIIYAEDGNDTIYIGFENNNISGDQSTAKVYGGNGNDTITSHRSQNILHGGEGEDIISTTNNKTNTLLGGLGDDTITGGNGNDIIWGYEKIETTPSPTHHTLKFLLGGDNYQNTWPTAEIIINGRKFTEFTVWDKQGTLNVWGQVQINEYQIEFDYTNPIESIRIEMETDRGSYYHRTNKIPGYDLNLYVGDLTLDGENLGAYSSKSSDAGGWKAPGFQAQLWSNSASVTWSNITDSEYYDNNDGTSDSNGDDILTGGSGEDIFIFEKYWGHDIITDFEIYSDQIVFASSTLNIDDFLIQYSEEKEGILVSNTETNSSILFAGISENNIQHITNKIENAVDDYPTSILENIETITSDEYLV